MAGLTSVVPIYLILGPLDNKVLSDSDTQQQDSGLTSASPAQYQVTCLVLQASCSSGVKCQLLDMEAGGGSACMNNTRITPVALNMDFVVAGSETRAAMFSCNTWATYC